MVFNSKTARLAGYKRKRDPSKKIHENILKKMEILCEDVLDYIIKNQEKLSMFDWIKFI